MYKTSDNAVKILLIITKAVQLSLALRHNNAPKFPFIAQSNRTS